MLQQGIFKPPVLSVLIDAQGMRSMTECILLAAVTERAHAQLQRAARADVSARQVRGRQRAESRGGWGRSGLLLWGKQ